MAACGGLCLGFKVCPAHAPFNNRSPDRLRGIGGRLPVTNGPRALFGSRTAPQNSLGWGQTATGTWLVSFPLPGPLCPLMLGAGTWKEDSDYFIAGFRAASGAVLRNVALGRVSLCFY